MTSKEFLARVEASRQRRDAIMFNKSKDYSLGRDDDDRLFNFKLVAELTGLTPLQVWSVYFTKHITSILSYVKTGRDDSEGIEGRFDDAVNYLDLGEALIKEGD